MGGDRVRGWKGGADSERGLTLIELLIVLGLMASAASLAVPVTAHAVDALRGRQAAGFLAASFRAAQQSAVSTGRATAVVFDPSAAGWTLRMCRDGNGNGIRRAEITAGIDPCPDGPWSVAVRYPGVRLSVDSSIPGPDGDPPTTDAVRFGKSDLASFSPVGSSTAGTVFLRSKDGVQYAVRVGNVTGRTRVLRYDPGAHQWRDE